MWCPLPPPTGPKQIWKVTYNLLCHLEGLIEFSGAYRWNPKVCPDQWLLNLFGFCAILGSGWKWCALSLWHLHMSQTNLHALAGHLCPEAHLHSSPQSVGLEPQDLLICEVPFSSESLTSRKVLVKEPKDGDGGNNCPAQRDSRSDIFVFFCLSFCRVVITCSCLSSHPFKFWYCLWLKLLKMFTFGGHGFQMFLFFVCFLFVFDPHITESRKGNICSEVPDNSQWPWAFACWWLAFSSLEQERTGCWTWCCCESEERDKNVFWLISASPAPLGVLA